MNWRFWKKTPPPPEGKWIQPDCQWGVGDRCCRVGDLGNTGNSPPTDTVLIVSAVFEGTLVGSNDRSVGLHFANWPKPVNSDYHGWTALVFRKVNGVKKAEETEVGEKILKSKAGPDIMRKPVKADK